MQLFIGPFKIQWDKILIHDEEIINQCRRVLRANIWYELYIQEKKYYWYVWPILRYHTQIISIESKEILVNIIEIQTYQHQPMIGWVVIWTPNKIDKIELIVQKLTELGVGRIVFVHMKRSVLPYTMSDNKLKRIEMIIKEAAEQSRRFTLPIVAFENNLIWYLSNKSLIFDTKWSDTLKPWSEAERIIVWPEWWYDPKEINLFEEYHVQHIKLQTPILRTETAAIIAWRKRNEYNTSS